MEMEEKMHQLILLVSMLDSRNLGFCVLKSRSTRK